jgi:uncharacterized protein YigA (DUF484 family)
METALQVAIVSAALSIIGASLTFYLTKRAERRDRLQQRKLEHYSQLLGAISDLASDGADQVEANERFNRAVNTIVLVAPQEVVDAVMAFHDEIKFSNPNRTLDGHDRRLNELVLAIRKSLELPFPDNAKTFRFHLVGRKPSGIGYEKKG